MKKKLIAVTLTTTIALAALAGCGNASSDATGLDSSDKDTSAVAENGVTTITVGYPTSSFPLAYEDESGNLTGYEIEVLKEVDERLEDIQFEYETAGQDALYAGLGTGKYDLVISNAFYTDQRAENYVLTENPIGASVVGTILRKDVTGIETFEDIATNKLKLSPILAGDGLYFVVYQYNQANPDNQIELTATDDPNSFIESVGWVAEGRYDVSLYPRNYWESVIADENGELHQYYDQVQFIENRSVNTYAVLAKGEEDIAKEISDQFGALKEEGFLEKLSEQFYGYNAFAYNSEN
ncbi:MAG: transporter substrate-binding domain-containing protein [Lachnospiraceae bacterium]|nr:transporter substrate-binding domain-containing protein [Lachnospiraceae bacterium]MBQ2502879.1 transporter substrate-binding domain-containing protein [Lachnospiraceae bacterium]MBR0430204.1 transporter substrate-binding domain-containing protein [Lachnospiraceae bacterium]